jgi:RNA polymerase sigma factor (sigma-70 family)
MEKNTYDRLKRIASGIDPDGDADCLHDAFVETKSEQPKLLVGRCKMRAIDAHRRTKKMQPHYLAQRCKVIDAPIPASEDDPDSPLVKAELREARMLVQAAIQNLSSKLQRIVRLYWWDQLSVREIAQRESCPPATVYTQLRRLKEELATNQLLRSLGSKT